MCSYLHARRKGTNYKKHYKVFVQHQSQHKFAEDYPSFTYIVCKDVDASKLLFPDGQEQFYDK